MNSRTTAVALVIASCLIVGCGKPEPTASDPQSAPDSPAVAPSGPATVAPPAPAAGTAAIREITFDDIKLEMQKGDPFTRDLLPTRVTALERQPVRIRGYILPSFQQSGLTQFVLVRDNQECCFGPGAALHDCVVVRMQPGQTAEFSIRPVAVEGRFRLEELRGPDGRHLAIYALDGERVQ